VLWGGGYAAARFLTGSFAAGLAREISAAAARLQAPHDPAAVQHVQVAIDALDIAKARPFWHSVLGYAAAGDEDAQARTPGGRDRRWLDAPSTGDLVRKPAESPRGWHRGDRPHGRSCLHSDN
jgi:hypothetical protein